MIFVFRYCKMVILIKDEIYFAGSQKDVYVRINNQNVLGGRYICDRDVCYLDSYYLQGMLKE